MGLGRFLRTARHFSAEQFAFLAIRRIRHSVRRQLPHFTRARISSAAKLLPHPDPARPAFSLICKSAMLLQKAVHGESLDDIRSGRFSIHGHTFQADSLANIDWHGDIGEGNSPLRRLTLAYFGWAVPLLAEGQAADASRVSEAIDSLDRVPWSAPGIFRDLWNPYTASHRLINLLTGLHLYHSAGGDLRSPAAVRLCQHIRFCAALISSDPERDLQANHLFKNWVALAVFAAATPEPQRLFIFLEDRITASLTQLVLADGGHAERSPMYHALCMLDVEMIRASGVVPGLEDRLHRTAEQMRLTLGLLTHPDGDIALFNDAWLGGAPSPRTLGIRLPAPGAHGLPETGYVRLDGGDDVVIFDCGACALDQQPGHAHADFLSVEASIAGSRFIVDPGTPTYTSGPLRNACRSAATHNGPHLSGTEPLEFWQSFRVGRRATAGGLVGTGLDAAPLWCAGWQDGYRRHGAEPRRWIGLWPGRALLIVDLWSGAAVEGVSSRFLVPQPWELQPDRKVLTFTGQQRVICSAVAGRLETPQRAVWWPRYGEEAPATTFALRPDGGKLPASSALLLSWNGSPPPVTPGMIDELASSLGRARRTVPAGFVG